MCEQVILSIKLSHGNRLWVEDIYLNSFVDTAAHGGLTLQSCYRRT